MHETTHVSQCLSYYPYSVGLAYIKKTGLKFLKPTSHNTATPICTLKELPVAVNVVML